MTDTPMTQDKHDTLIDRLEKEACRAENGRFSSRELYAPVMREAISRLKQVNEAKTLAALELLLKTAEREPTCIYTDNMIAAMKNAHKVIREVE